MDIGRALTDRIQKNLIDNADNYMPKLSQTQIDVLSQEIFDYLNENEPERFEEISITYAEEDNEETTKKEINDSFGENFECFRRDTLNCIDFDYCDHQLVEIVFESLHNAN